MRKTFAFVQGFAGCCYNSIIYLNPTLKFVCLVGQEVLHGASKVPYLIKKCNPSGQFFYNEFQNKVFTAG